MEATRPDGPGATACGDPRRDRSDGAGQPVDTVSEGDGPARPTFWPTRLSSVDTIRTGPRSPACRAAIPTVVDGRMVVLRPLERNLACQLSRSRFRTNRLAKSLRKFRPCDQKRHVDATDTLSRSPVGSCGALGLVPVFRRSGGPWTYTRRGSGFTTIGPSSRHTKTSQNLWESYVRLPLGGERGTTSTILSSERRPFRMVSLCRALMVRRTS